MKNYNAAERFFERVYPEPNTGCWLYSGGMNPGGYGVVYGTRCDDFNLAHRYSYFLHNGDFDRSLCVLHKCDNPICVNPDHLFLGTLLDNNRDRANKNRTVAPKGQNNHLSVLKESDAIEILRLYKNGGTPTKISKQLAIKRETINGIIHNRNWKHLPR